ncbi:hypothetical protein A8C56_20925 [Niabella ginsenosidivorans]|uniref:Uncharacterized protein n=1 Tax=Niabella ginsenosidivorans TaxID=1176587 RepID=A0A1A9I9B5_9BACT|nr:hypothetical protein A8C56_20925 [Niabella ginsenosidivorans]
MKAAIIYVISLTITSRMKWCIPCAVPVAGCLTVPFSVNPCAPARFVSSDKIHGGKTCAIGLQATALFLLYDPIACKQKVVMGP